MIAPRRLRRRLGLRERGAEARRLENIARSSRPIVAGPWTGPVGLELLYWVPLLNWLTTEAGVDPERVIAISRGGAGPWYADVSGKYVELLDHFSVEQLRHWDRDSARLDRRAFDSANEIGAEWLHPVTLRRLFRARWDSGASSSVIASHTVHKPLPEDTAETPRLPDSYAAVKAYFGPSLPDTPENRSLLQGTVDRLAETTDVVLLAAPEGIGGHEPFVPEGNRRAHDVALELPTNLAVQTRIVRAADVLVSTYGGFSYLGPYVGTPTLALYSNAPREPAHLDLIDRVGRQLGEGRTRLFRARHVGMLTTRD